MSHIMPTTGDAAAEGDVREFDPDDPRFRVEAYETYREMRESCPFTRIRAVRQDGKASGSDGKAGAAGDLTLLATRYDEGVAALLDPRFTVDPTKLQPQSAMKRLESAAGHLLSRVDRRVKLGMALSRDLTALDPPDHTRLRRLVQPSFTAGEMEKLRPRVQAIADALLDAAEREAAGRGESAPDRAMELVRAFAYPLPVTVISEMLGIPSADHGKAREWTEHLLENPDSLGRLDEFADYLLDLFERRRRDPQDDLVTRLVQAEEEGDRLSPDELLTMVVLLYLAGFITTVNMIGNGTVALLAHPEQLAAFRADPSLAANVVEETLRYWGPAESSFVRTALEDVEIGGQSIRRGERVQACFAAMDRDPARFANPDAFDIARADANRHVAFGKGVHVCLGSPLARLEGRIAFETLFGRYPDLRLAVPAGDVCWNGDLLRGFEEIPLRF